MLSRLIKPKVRQILLIAGVALVVLFIFKSVFGFIFKVLFIIGILGFIAFTAWRYVERLKG